MKVLVACEYSGIVREAFRRRGHDAWSCDLLDTEQPGPHYKCDVLEVLGLGWDLMIAHPPCTYLSRAGARFWNTPGRAEKRDEAMAFFMELWNAPLSRVCVENQVGYPWSMFRRPDQIINPFQFGDPARKKTCLWMRGLPLLVTSPGLFQQCTTKAIPAPSPVFVEASGCKARHFTDSIGNVPDRWKIRSRTFPGIAEAMAEQWGNLETKATSTQAAERNE